jgi:hypothetical protein
MLTNKVKGDPWSATIRFSPEGPAQDVQVSAGIRFSDQILLEPDEFPVVHTNDDAIPALYTATVNGSFDGPQVDDLLVGASGALVAGLYDLAGNLIMNPVIEEEAYAFRAAVLPN